MAFSVIFMTLFLVKDLPSYRRSLLGLLGNESATQWHSIGEQVITTTSRYMIGNIVISIICATIYGITAVLLGLPYALALAVIAGVLDLIPNIGSLIAGIIIGIVALTVSPAALVIFVVVILVYQQFENYVLQPTIIGKAADISGFLVILSVLVLGCAVRSGRCDRRRADHRGHPDRRQRADRRPPGQDRGRTAGRRRSLGSGLRRASKVGAGIDRC